jgi:hypothetical protein
MQWTEKKTYFDGRQPTNYTPFCRRSINQYSLFQNAATISDNLADIPATIQPEGKFSPSMPWRVSEEK